MEYIDFKSQLLTLIEERKAIDINDELNTYKFWEKASDFTVKNIQNTISFLKECDEETANWLSEIFEDIAEKSKSKEIVAMFEELDIKYPELKLTSFVEGAKSFL